MKRPDHDKQLVDLVIARLQTEPHKFSFIWEDGTLKEGARHSAGDILVTKWGGIVLPFMPRMKGSERREIRKLVEPIYERESYEVFQKML